MPFLQKEEFTTPSNYYISFKIKTNKESKLIGIMPTHVNTIHNQKKESQYEICYELNDHIQSAKQFRWLSTLKQRLKYTIKAKIEFTEHFTITPNTKTFGDTYTLQQIDEVLKPLNIKYPILCFTSDRDSLYKHLCWYGAKLHYQGLMSIEELISASIQLNKYVDKPYNRKELISKALSVNEYITSNPDKHHQKLSVSGLTNKNTEIRNKNKVKVSKLLKNEIYLKPNGRPNITKIAKKLNLSRQTVTDILHT